MKKDMLSRKVLNIFKVSPFFKFIALMICFARAEREQGEGGGVIVTNTSSFTIRHNQQPDHSIRMLNNADSLSKSWKN